VAHWTQAQLEAVVTGTQTITSENPVQLIEAGQQQSATITRQRSHGHCYRNAQDNGMGFCDRGVGVCWTHPAGIWVCM